MTNTTKFIASINSTGLYEFTTTSEVLEIAVHPKWNPRVSLVSISIGYQELLYLFEYKLY